MRGRPVYCKLANFMSAAIVRGYNIHTKTFCKRQDQLWLEGNSGCNLLQCLPYLYTARGPSFMYDPRILLATLGAADQKLKDFPRIKTDFFIDFDIVLSKSIRSKRIIMYKGFQIITIGYLKRINGKFPLFLSIGQIED